MKRTFLLTGALIAGTLGGTLALGVGVAAAAGQTQSPGYTQASTVGSCHGYFGGYEGTNASSSPTPGFSSFAPMGDLMGTLNAVGSCPYQGVPAPTFPPA